MTAKYQKIAASIRSKINDGTYPPGASLPTEQVFCEIYNASRQTVRQALQLLVQENLIERHQGRGSRVLPPAQTLPAAKTNRTVAVVITYINDYIFPAILREIESVLSANGCSTLLFATKNQIANERRILLDLLDLPELYGVIVEGTKTALPNPNIDLYRQLQNRSIPLVFINGNYRELTGAISVLDDNYGGAYKLVQYLHAKGHRHIAGIFKFDDIQGHQRYAGYIAALQDLGLPIDDTCIFWFGTSVLENGILTPPSHEACERIYNTALKNCTAVVCYCDAMAFPLLQYLQQRNIRIPEEMAIVSFDNCILSQANYCRITSLSHEDQNIGHIAAELLIKMQNNIPCQSQVVPWTLIEKESG